MTEAAWGSHEGSPLPPAAASLQSPFSSNGARPAQVGRRNGCGYVSRHILKLLKMKASKLNSDTGTKWQHGGLHRLTPQ